MIIPIIRLDQQLRREGGDGRDELRSMLIRQMELIRIWPFVAFGIVQAQYDGSLEKN